MTVKELIQKLQDMPPAAQDAPVILLYDANAEVCDARYHAATDFLPEEAVLLLTE